MLLLLMLNSDYFVAGDLTGFAIGLTGVAGCAHVFLWLIPAIVLGSLPT